MIEIHNCEFSRWLARYIVIKRVSIETKYQSLYNNFLNAINDSYLEKAIKEETFRNIKVVFVIK
jgi:hypothetical protein